MTTKLTLGNWLDPRNSNVHANSDDADDPEHLGEVAGSALDSCEPEDDGEDLELMLEIVGLRQ